MDNMQNIQWFPGHMAKTRRKITESLNLVDAVVEIVDARIPASSRNPELQNIINNKPRLIVMNKSDLAGDKANAEWINYFKNNSMPALLVDCKSGKGINNFKAIIRSVLADKLEYYKSKGMVGKKLRIMIVGIPNVGKSSFINKLIRNTRAKVEDRPGVTRGNQWYSVDNEIELLDTPGVLWPKFEDPKVGERLAFCGSVKDEIIDTELLGIRLAEVLGRYYPETLMERYKIKDCDLEPYDLLCAIGKARGMVMRGGEIDTERAAIMLLDEFRGGKLGKITLEFPEE